MKKLKVAMIGIAHTHAGVLYYEFSLHQELFDWVGYADITSDLGETVEERRQRNFYAHDKLDYYDDYKEIIKMKPDIIIINTDIKSHGDIVSEILSEDINVVVEKPMAIDMKDALKMYEAAKKSKGELIINWPIAWFPYFNLAKELVDKGEIGEVLRVQYRSPATWGPYEIGAYSTEELNKMWWYDKKSGGGAIMDYACYGCVLTTWFFDKQAESVYGIKKNFLHGFSDIEDYATFTLDFGTGVGFLESSWSTFNSGEIPTGPVVFGTKGTLVSDRYTNAVKLYSTPSHDLKAPDKIFDFEGKKEDSGENILNHFINGTPLHEILTLDFNMKAMSALDAGIRSCESGKFEETVKY